MQTYYENISRDAIMKNVERAMKDWRNARSEVQVKDADKDFDYWAKQLERFDNGLPIQLRKRAAWY